MKAHELIADPSRWTQYVSARDKNGFPTHALSLRARSWCTLGAISRCYQKNDDRLDAIEKITKAIRVKYKGDYYNPSLFNDTHKHEEVIQLLKEVNV